jgi:hypothetical protein
MKCARFRDLLDAYSDGEMDETLSELMKEHIRNCPECEAMYSLRNRLSCLLHAHGPDINDIDLSDAIMKRIQTLPAPVTPNPLKRPALYALLAALLISGSLMILGYAGMPDTISPADLLKLISYTVNLPEEMQASLYELWAFLNALGVIVRTFLWVVVQIARIVLVKLPVKIPIAVFSAAGVIVAGWWYRRQRKHSTFTGLRI